MKGSIMCYTQGLRPYGIKVATGEMCQNRVMFKQFLQAGAMDFCQIDACRIGGVNEILTVVLMAKKFNGIYNWLVFTIFDLQQIIVI